MKAKTPINLGSWRLQCRGFENRYLYLCKNMLGNKKMQIRNCPVVHQECNMNNSRNREWDLGPVLEGLVL